MNRGRQATRLVKRSGFRWALPALLAACSEATSPSYQRTPTVLATATWTEIPRRSPTPSRTPTASAASASPTYTRTATSTPSPTATLTASGTPTATPENQRPQSPPLTLYRAIVGRPIAVPVGIHDPDNDPLTFELAYAPTGLQLDTLLGTPRLLWLPSEADLGPHFVRVVGTEPVPGSAAAVADYCIEVAASSACATEECDPAVGCTSRSVPIEQPCCHVSDEPQRFPVPSLPCPQGRMLLVGRNLAQGFGALRHCSRFRVINFGQIGATVRLNLATRCLAVDQPILVAARMRTANRELFDAPRVVVTMQAAGDGFARRLGLAFPVRGPGPFFEFEGAEAELYVSATDSLDQRVETWLRLRLTFEELPDLEDLPQVEPPWTDAAAESWDSSGREKRSP